MIEWVEGVLTESITCDVKGDKEARQKSLDSLSHVKSISNTLYNRCEGISSGCSVCKFADAFACALMSHTRSASASY